ncbi:hypothetical protein [Trebonia kvetii]|uniref:hypothetical protein n=1 Tax=Trebonia kvetii TaxID=2480626 RepID=UPI0016520BCE|nr:hypothetical protein [Trebonia kvetii]
MAPANSFAGGALATAQLGDVATAPVDGTGAAINLNQTAAEAAASLNCSLAVPANPLTAAGLATPWQLGDGCSMANAGTEGAFVEATILAPNGQLSVYSPLVVTTGTQPAAAPVAPTIAAGSVVEISVGFNGTNLFLTGAGATQGNCVDALGQSVFGQVSTCNSVAFYQAAKAAIANGTLQVPAAGTATNGQACQTSRSFPVIDQDQSDNVVTQYLITAGGQTAVNSPANNAQLQGATVLTNGSDNALISEFIDPATGCTPFTAPDSTYPKPNAPSQALNELQAMADQQGTIATVPPNDEMTLVGGQMSIDKTNAYRSIVGQPLLAAGTDPAIVAASYCQNMVNLAPTRNNADMAADAAFASPVPTVGNSLATFLGNRLSMSFVNLGCANYGLTNPVNATLDGNGVATAVSFNLAQQTAKGAAAAGTTTPTTAPTAGAPNPTAGQTTGTQSRGTRRHRFINPSGM